MTDQSALADTARAEVELAAVAREVMAAAQTISGRLIRNIRVWPGGALSFVGVGLLCSTFGIEIVAPSRLGTVEFAVSLVTGALLALAGPLVIARSVAKADEMTGSVVTSAFDAWKASRIKNAAETAKDHQ